MVRRLALLALALLGTVADARGGAQARGLWVGPIHLCRDSVAEAVIASDERGAASVIITLRPRWRAQLERETGRRVGRPMAIRLNGRTIQTPRVMEPLTGGVLTLVARTPAQAEAIRASGRRGAC